MNNRNNLSSDYIEKSKAKGLNKFLFKPKAYLKGTKMSFAGLKKASDRAAIIAYLTSLSDSPKPFQ